MRRIRWDLHRGQVGYGYRDEAEAEIIVSDGTC
jgi:hypothetical protein